MRTEGPNQPGRIDLTQYQHINPLGQQKVEPKKTELVKDEKLGLGTRIKRFFRGKPSGKKLASKSLKQAKAEGLVSTQLRVKKEKRRTARQVAANIVTFGGYGRRIADKQRKSRASDEKLYDGYAAFKDSIRSYLDETNISAIKNEIKALEKERDSYRIQQQGGRNVFPLELADKSKRLAELEEKLKEYEAVVQCKRDLTALMRLDLNSQEAEVIKLRLNVPHAIKVGTATSMIE